MFGYVKPSMERLSPEEKARYQGLYCGLCHTLGRRYGPVSRLILNFDFTFLAALLAPSGQTEQRRCVSSPFRAKAVEQACTALDLAADCSVILTWHKLRDGLLDCRFPKREGYRVGAAALNGAYRRAAERCPGFAEQTAREMDRLLGLEKDRCPTLDEPADTFACLLQGIALELPDERQRRIFGQFLYHLGRWIYLVDALDDCKKDAEEGNYNPILLRFGLSDGVLTDEARHTMVTTLDASVRQMAAAYELWDFGVWSPVIQATVYEGLYCVANAVLEGTFHAAARPVRTRGKKEQL